MNRRGEVHLHAQPVGLLEESEEGFSFTYEKNYVALGGRPVSASLPTRIEPYQSKRLFPFFEGMLAEGELRKIQTRLAKLSEEDTFGLLLISCGSDAPGAVTIHTPLAAPA